VTPFLLWCFWQRLGAQEWKAGRSITEIALACGFNSSQYFATRFRRRFKMSPRQFVSKPGNFTAKK